jgi:hypothetical protein
VILFKPGGNWDVVSLVVPPLSVVVPRTIAPFRKLTFPVGVPPDDDETVAVKVTALPDTEGFTEEVNCVVVGAYIILATKAPVPRPFVA